MKKKGRLWLNEGSCVRLRPERPTMSGPMTLFRIAAVGAKTVYIEPGSPWENGCCESFNVRFRDERLNSEIF